MTRYADLPRNTIWFMDWIKALRKRQDKSVHCFDTSPPFYHQRSYGDLEGEIGQEETPDAYIKILVEGSKEIWRVLRDDGTFWLNLGDATYQGSQYLFPARVAIALMVEGWILRRANRWFKPNSMPKGFSDMGFLPGGTQKVMNRTSLADEDFFMFTKTQRYYYDAEAIGEPYSEATLKEIEEIYEGQATKDYAATGAQDSSEAKRSMITSLKKGWANKKSVWSINTKGFKGAHTATFPKELPRIAILAGTSEKGCCPECGAPWIPIFQEDRIATRPGTNSKIKGMTAKEHGSRDPERHVTIAKKVGWKPSCECGVQVTVPCTVYDPFMGSGTTAEVAAGLKRWCIGSELNSANLELIKTRLGLHWGIGNWQAQFTE